MGVTGQRYRTASPAGLAHILLGLWVIISPFVLGFARLEAWKWNNVASGLLVTLGALGFGPRTGTAIVLPGIWLVISAFIFAINSAFLFATGYTTPLWNNVTSGALILIVSLAAGTRQDRAFRSRAPD